MESDDTDRPLPESMLIHSAENELFKDGLQFVINSHSKPRLIHRTFFVYIVFSIQLIKCSVSLLLPNESEELAIIIGDFANFLGVRLHFNLCIILLAILALSSQLLHYSDHINGTKPSYLEVFKMMSGLVTPKSIEFTDEEELEKFMKLAQHIFSIVRLNNNLIIPMLAITANLFPYLMSSTLSDILCYGLPHTLVYSLFVYYVFDINIWNFTYFYLICRYTKIKLKISNALILTDAKQGMYLKLCSTLFNIHREVIHLNATYWSKYLLSIWIMFALAINTGIYCALFVKMNFISRLIFSYGVISLLGIFLVIINAASAVNLEAFKVYKFLNNMMCSEKRRTLLPILRRLKVMKI
jgi:hypothetical protein